MSSTKFSRQRESIKDYLHHTNSHPNADEVYMNIRESFPNISLGTVYRNLNYLVEQGEAIKLTCGDDSIHYDGNMTPHYHFVCRECKRVMDIKMDLLDHINILASAHFDGLVEGHTTFFYGRCPECIKKTKVQHDKV